MPLLRTEGLSKDFPGVRALRNVDFDLKAGEIHAVVGENGAGKSSLVHVVSGIYPPTSGRIWIDDDPVSFASPADAIRLGVGLVSQEGNLVPYFTVGENVTLGKEPGAFGIINRGRSRAMTQALMEQLGIELDMKRPISELSPAEQKLAEILRVLNLRPRILILDEPTAFLDEHDSKRLFDLMLRLRNESIGIIFISHFLDEVFLVSDRVTVLCDGLKIGTHPTHAVTKGDLVRMMINRDIPELYQRHRSAVGKPLLEARRVMSEGLHDINLTVCEREIVGVYGMVGAGQTELAEVLFGAVPRVAGEILVNSRPVPLRSVREAISHGIYLIPENRMVKALVGRATVQENVSLAHLEDLCRFTIIDRANESVECLKILNQLRVDPPEPSMDVHNLSGGNKQKVSLGRWVFGRGAQRGRIFIFNEPTQGLDIGARTEVHRLTDQLAQTGAGLLFISSDLPELLTMADRIYVVRRGTIVDEVNRTQATQERILRAALAVEAGGAEHVGG